MAAKVGKKKKGKTMALTDFLSDEQGNVQGPGSSYVLANKSMDWAAEMEQLDTAYPEPYADKMVDRTKLPTAPKASRGADYDIEKMPTEPPYTAFIGNLPYEATEEMIEQFFCKLAVLNVRLPEDNGRLRGFGYVEFETQQALIDSLAMSEDSMGGRKIRVDLAGQNQQHPGSGRDAGRGGDPDRSEGDWRRPSAAAPESGGGSAWGRDRDGDRNSSKDGGGRAEQDGPWQRSGSSFQDRGSRGGFEDRGGSRGGGFDDRGGGYNRDRGFGGGGFDRDGDRDGGRRGFGSGFDRDGGDRRGYGNRSGGFGDRDRGSFGGDRDRGSFGGDRDRGSFGGDRDRGSFGGDRDRGYGGDRDRGFGGDRGGERSERYEPREPREPASGASDTAKERPRLQLQPRSKPAEKSGGETSSSIFGGAKPVDTAQREREIEERLLKQRQEQAVAPLPRSSFSNRYDDDKENRDTYDSEHSSAVSSRKRSDSDRSHDGDGRRERRLSSGSGKGRKAPPITSQRSRKDSEHSSHSNEVFSGNEDTKAEDSSSNANVPVSPSQRDEPPANYVPAPPPKENIWEKRKTTLSPQQQKDGGPKSPTADGTAPATQPKQPQSHAAASRGSEPRSPGSQSTAPKSPSAEGASPTSRPSAANQKKDFVPADPPKENPWARKKQEVESTPPVHRTEPAVTNPPPPSGAWGRGASTGDGGRGGRGGRGGGPSDRGRGRGARPQKQQRERQLPTSIEDMPKLEEKSTKDFSVSNKFSGLVEDEHDGGNDE